jgi:hypothetical protein
MVLNHIAASILYLLWKRRRSNDGSLVAANVLRNELLAGLAKAQFRDDLKISAVKKTLRRLKAAELIEYGESKKSDSAPGPAPNGYRLSADPPIITWRASAAIVVFLHNHPERRLRRETIIEEAVNSGLTHHNRDEHLDPREVSDLIDWCVRKGYIREEEVAIDEASNFGTRKLLMTTSKVDDCDLFLQKLAAEVKRQVAAEQPSSRLDEGDAQKRS